MRYLPVSVFKNPLGDCTNGGVSAEVDTIYIQCKNGNYGEEEVPEQLRFRPEKRGESYWAAIPELTRPGCGPMHGGNLAWTSDSRLEPVYHIHDRFE